MRSMRASVLVDVARMEVRDVPAPVPGAHDVLVRVSAVGVCGTDFHIHGGESNFNLDEHGAPIPLTREPQILGHEITGTVLEVGREVRGLRPGSKVVLDQGLSCKSARRETSCEYCATGDSHQCEFYREHGITGLPGGFAELISIPAVNAVRITSGLDPALAAMTEPLACVMHSTDFVARARSRYGFGDGREPVRTALVLGAGPAGLLFVQTLRNVLGFDGTILVCERNEKKRELARSFGADVLAPGDMVEGVLERTRGRRVELLVEATGSGPVFADIPALIRKQATVVLYGIGHGGASLELLNQLQWKEPTLIASIGASGGFDDDGKPTIYRRALRAVEEGVVDVGSMISHVYTGIDSVPSAFSGDHEHPDYVKGVALLS